MQFKNRPAIGIKPPRLWTEAGLSIGSMIVVSGADAREKIDHIVCHEMTHAYCVNLELPMWLNEGLAMVTVDKYLGKQTVKPESLELLKRKNHRRTPESHRTAMDMGHEFFAFQYVRGYWITRFLDETRPELLRRLLKGRRLDWEVTKEIAQELGMDRHRFWEEVDQVVLDHFSVEAMPQSTPEPQLPTSF